MIPQNNTKEKALPEINIQFINAIRELKVSTLLRQSNIYKDTRSRNGDGGKKRTAFEIFQSLLLLVFEGYEPVPVPRFKKTGHCMCKEYVLPFPSNGLYNWRRSVLLLFGKAAAYFSTLTRPERVNCLTASQIPWLLPLLSTTNPP